MKRISQLFNRLFRLFTPKLGVVAGPIPTARSDTIGTEYVGHHHDWSKVARAESPHSPFANEGKCMCYEACGGHVVDLVKPDIFLYSR